MVVVRDKDTYLFAKDTVSFKKGLVGTLE